MPGSFDLDDYRPPLWGDALAVGVYRYNPVAAEEDEEPFEHLPNVRCLQVDYREGPDPPAARFEYITDDTLEINFGWPSQIEQLWPIDAQGPYVVHPDDRLVVLARNFDGEGQEKPPTCFFDGFAQIPQADVTPQSSRITFAAVGVAARAFDEVITGRVQRDADTPEDTSGASDVETDLPCRFNPADQSAGSDGGIRGNSTPNQFFTTDTGNTAFPGGTGLGDFPVFIDPLLAEREEVDEEDYVAPWYISDAVKYLLSQPSPGDDYLSYPDFAALDDLLSAWYPADDDEGNEGDVFNPETARTANILIRDYDATNKPMPEVLAELLGYAGFVMNWRTGADAEGMPETRLELFRRDAAASRAPKVLYLQPGRTAALDPAKNNVMSLHLARDANAIVNAWQVETAPRRVEVTVVLAPLYVPEAGDKATAQRKNFYRANLTNATATVRRKYRWYGADETGDGHWNCTENDQSVETIDLSPVFPDKEDGTRSYVKRYRPGSRTLISRDPQGRPLKATLEIYANKDDPATSPDPYIFEEQSALEWRTIPHGWRLLEDRLGIEVTVEDPEDWATGNPQLPKINGITWWADPPAAAPNGGMPPVLRLTTVIEDDLGIQEEEGGGIHAKKRTASPTRFTRWRAADGRDHFEYTEVSEGSPYYNTQTWIPGKTGIIRDDTKLARAHARQLRMAHELPPLAGSVTIPFLTDYYEIGDRIRQIKGRDVSLTTNVNQDQGESPNYPWVVGLSYTFEDDRQQTTLHLSDRRAEPLR